MDTFTGSKRPRRWDEAVTFPQNTVSLYVNLTVCWTICLSTFIPCMWQSVLSHFYYLLSHTPSLPLRIPLFVPAVLIDCLFISGPAAASVLEDEIVMVILIFCGSDKEVEIHREDIGLEPMQDRVKLWETSCVLLHSNTAVITQNITV